MDFKKFLYTKPIIIDRKKYKTPPKRSVKTFLTYLKLNNKKYVIDKNNFIRIILNEDPLLVKYLNKENIDYISQDIQEDFFYTRNEFNNIYEISFDDYIIQTLNKNNIISDDLYFESELIKREYSLGNLQKYRNLIIDLKINYILVKLIKRKGSGIDISIYVIGDIYTKNEIFYDIGLGYLTSQGEILTNLYSNFLPKGWGSALLCLFLKISKKINIKNLFLEALDTNAKLFYERLGFKQDTRYMNPLNLKIMMNEKILNNYCLRHKIDLYNFYYMLKIDNKINKNLNLNELIDLVE